MGEGIRRKTTYPTPPVVCQRPKIAGGRMALPPGIFGSIQKIYGHGLLKTTLENRSEQPKICPDSSRCVQTAQIMSGQLKLCPDSPRYIQDILKICPDSSKYKWTVQNLS